MELRRVCRACLCVRKHLLLLRQICPKLQQHKTEGHACVQVMPTSAMCWMSCEWQGTR